METNINKNIKYYGAKSYEKSNIVDFSQFNIASTFSIDKIDNTIYEISKVWAQIKNISYEKINTPIGTSHENQILSGTKLLICANLDIKIEYISCNSENTIESMYVMIPVSTSVTLENDEDEYETEYPSILIEDIYCNKIDSKKFYLSVMMIAIVDIF